MNTITVIKKLQSKDCTSEIFSDFNRYQEVKRCWRKENGEWLLKDIAFTNQWNDEQKAERVVGLLRCIQQGGVVIGAFVDNTLIGFSSVLNHLFGSNDEYIQLEMLHVSYEFRGNGIGKALFHEICGYAKELGAKKLYISAHSAEETQAFYKSVGCVETTELNQKLFEEEPVDCHLEYCLM
ncbi:MAG: GNAT family N-acetyltransferase [Oscillospiraceae bacterium]|nr:GNAT family N-acetyltransferase [Oscillospiraceae bacterium]